MGSKMDAVTNGVQPAAGRKIIVSSLGMWDSPVANAVARVATKGLKSLAMRRGFDLGDCLSWRCLVSAEKSPKISGGGNSVNKMLSPAKLVLVEDIGQ